MQSEGNSKALTITKINITRLTWPVTLILVASILPHYIHNQLITGTIVNATLFLGATMLGSGLAATIGLVPSVAALASGLLPLALAPMVPFIMISNAILVLAFSSLRKNNFWLAAITASLLKYLFLLATTSVVTKIILQKTTAIAAATTMMNWLQLATALVGATIAYGILKSSKSKEI